jgi:bla regulator protein blaR1
MHNERARMRISRSFLYGVAYLVALVGFYGPPGWAQLQSGASEQQPQAAAPKSFEVASIKPSAPIADGRMMVRMGTSPGGRWTASGVTPSMLIQQAYDVREYQISGGPGWLTTERYDIVAKAETPDVDRETLRVLLQSLLAERFNLQIHRETKELPIYELVVGKGGHKLHKSEIQPDTQPADPAKTGEGAGASRARGGAGPAGAAANPSGGTGQGIGGGLGTGAGAPPKGASMIRMGRGQLNAQSVPITAIVQMLAQQLGRPVIDKTEIKGNFDFNLQWTPDETQRGMGIGGLDRPAADSPLPADTSGPSLFTAVQEQLGLKLEASKGAVETLVIDRVEKASGN